MSSASLRYAPVLIAVMAGLYLTSLYNYLLFHSLAELFSIVVAFSVFTIAWNTRKHLGNQYLLIVGVSCLFVGFLDLMHTLSYKGMMIFRDYDYYANQLWIAARGMESLTLLAAFLVLYRKTRPNPRMLLSLYAAVTALLLLSIFVWKNFPICFVDGSGQTRFKIYAEYAICLTLGASLWLLLRKKDAFEEHTHRLVAWSITFTIVSELAFTFYISNYGFSNLVGHYFKIFAFLGLYAAIVKNGLEKPAELLFMELTAANLALKAALEEIKTLKGIIPICSYCKKIRTDEGYWQQLESFIAAHSEAEFTHGICPECVKEHFSEYLKK